MDLKRNIADFLRIMFVYVYLQLHGIKLSGSVGIQQLFIKSKR